MTSVVELRVLPDALSVAWGDGRRSQYPWLWLRDHAHDPETLHPVTQQRQLFTAGLPHTLRGTAVSVEGDTVGGDIVGGDTVVVEWNDPAQPPSRIPVAFLARFREPVAAPPGPPIAPVPWDAASIAEAWPALHHDEVLGTEAGVCRWLELVAAHGFCIVEGVPIRVTATESLLRRVAYVRETIFGGMWDFQADLAKADTAYTTLELRPHTDGTYSHDAPGLQLLHCLAFDGTGGESTMVDGFRIAAELRTAAPEHYRTLSTVEVPGQYIGDGSHLRASRPVFRHDSAGVLVQVSFNNYDRAPFLLPPDEMAAFYGALRAFEALANDPRLQWRRVLRPGQAVLFDNWRVLHGRAAFTGHRHLAGGYVNREDYESRLRTTCARPGAAVCPGDPG